MDVNWSISAASGTNGSLAALGIEGLTGKFMVNGPSTASFTIAADYDAAGPDWTPDSLVTILRDGVPWFQGRVHGKARTASGTHEGRTLELVDEWQSLEQETYTEPWRTGDGTEVAEYPNAYLGINSDGDPITTGQQIEQALDLAISRGALLQKGAIPTGVTIWPSEVQHASCADVIHQSMKWHPDWIAYVDHSTSPPTFNVKAMGTLATAVVSPPQCMDFSSTPVIDNVPRGVKITYVSASVVDGETYRTVYEDTAGASTGLKILRAVVDLAGLQMQFQKSRIRTRHIPLNAGEAKLYFRQKFPQIAGGTGSWFSVESFSTQLLAPIEEDYPQPINPEAERLIPAGLSEVPRELVDGSIEDWMRKKVGKVQINFKLKASKTAPDEVKTFVKRLNTSGALEITATNAQTKLYKSITQWTPAEGVPDGLAGSVFAAASIPQFKGSFSLVEQDCTAVRYCGGKVNLSGQADEAVVLSHSWDIETGITRVEFGPSNAMLSPADFVELQRMVATRPVKWISKEERSSNQLGAKDHPGSKGDTVSGFNHPSSQLYPPPTDDSSDSDSDSGSGADESDDSDGGGGTSGDPDPPDSGSSHSDSHSDPDPPPDNCCPDDCIVTVSILSPSCISRVPEKQIIYVVLTASMVNDGKCIPGCYERYVLSGFIGTTELSAKPLIIPGEAVTWPADSTTSGLIKVRAPIAGCLWVGGHITVESTRSSLDEDACPKQYLSCTYPFWFRLPPWCGDSSCSSASHP